MTDPTPTDPPLERKGVVVLFNHLDGTKAKSIDFPQAVRWEGVGERRMSIYNDKDVLVAEFLTGCYAGVFYKSARAPDPATNTNQ